MNRRRFIGFAAAFALVGLAITPSAVSETEAQWTDAEAASASLTAQVIPSITSAVTCKNISGGLLPSSAELSWTAPLDPPAGILYRITAVYKTSTQVKDVSQSPVTISTTLLSDLLGLLTGSTSDVDISIDVIYQAPGPSGATWKSATSAPAKIRYTAPVAGLLLGGFSCR